MTPRDYKPVAPRKRATRKESPRGGSKGSWMSFISGLSVGLVVAFGVYLWSGHLPVPGAGTSTPSQGANETYTESAPANIELPAPKFDFYKILPEMEVPIDDWELAAEPPDTAAPDADASTTADATYLLQVGSFKTFRDADSVKASLALSGIRANIQRVVINGQDVWFRVHVGPLSSAAEIRDMRVKLIENDMDFILLRIGEGA